MPTALRRALGLAVLVTLAAAPVRAQTVCGDLLPIGVVAPAGGFPLGCANRHVLRFASWPSQGGTYTCLDYPACGSGPCAGLTGVVAFVCAARSGYACCIISAQSVPIVAGNYVGPLRQGLGQRMADDSDTRVGICYSEYVGNGSRLCNLPLIQPVGNGQTHVEVAGFQRMFLVAPPSGNSDIVVEFVAGSTPARGASWGEAKQRYR